MNALLLLPSLLAGLAGAEAPKPMVLVVVGAEGTPEYGRQFAAWAGRWQAASDRAGAEFGCIGLADPGGGDRDALRQRLAQVAGNAESPLWLVLIGHGTFDGKTARFNLRGPDFTAQELAEWLGPLKRPLAVIHCGSSSGAFLAPLSELGRVVITATRSGHEINYARFGDYLSAAIADPQADFDKDGQTSLLEAYLSASRQTAEFYATQSRLATEHALLDDNGDGLGTPADWFRGVRATKTAKSGAAHDGRRAHQWHLLPSDRERSIPAELRKRRDELELAVFALRDSKAQLAEDEYYRRLERLMIELAELYEQAVPRKLPPAGDGLPD
jgi:hypothetical protein